MAEEMKKSNASSILANDTAPKSAKTMGGGMDKSAGMKPKHDTNAAAGNKPEHAAGGEKKTKHKHTHIEHHDNGTHTTRHTPADGGPDVSYASQDLDGVHDGLEHHVGDPNGEEAQAQPDAGAQPGAQPGGQPDAAAAGGAGAQPQAGAQPMAV